MKVDVTPGYSLLAIACGIAAPFYTAWAWNEFISPLGVPQINWASAFAIDSIFMWLTNDYVNRQGLVVKNELIGYLANHLVSSWFILYILSFFNEYIK